MMVITRERRDSHSGARVCVRYSSCEHGDTSIAAGAVPHLRCSHPNYNRITAMRAAGSNSPVAFCLPRAGFVSAGYASQIKEREGGDGKRNGREGIIRDRAGQHRTCRKHTSTEGYRFGPAAMRAKAKCTHGERGACNHSGRLMRTAAYWQVCAHRERGEHCHPSCRLPRGKLLPFRRSLEKRYPWDIG